MPAIYQIHIYDKTWLPVASSDGTFVAEVNNARQLEIERRPSQIDLIRFDVPRDDPAMNHISIGKVVRILREGKVEISGVIVGPLDKNQDPYVNVIANGKAELLNWLITPWSFQLKTNAPTSQIRELLNEYQFFRRNSLTEFNAGTLENTIVQSIAPATVTSADHHWVTLATESLTNAGTAVFVASGTFTGAPINLGSPNAFNRVRYDAQVGDTTDVLVQLRSAIDDAGTPSLWTAWSASQQVGIQDQQRLGITSFSVATPFSWAQSRFLLTTTSDLLTPALRAFELVGEYPFEIAAGNIGLPTTERKYTFNEQPHSRAIKQIADDNLAEFEVTSGFTLNVKSALGVTATGVLIQEHRDTNILRYEEDDETLVNGLWSVGGDGRGLSQMASYARSTTSMKAYGRRQGVFNAIGTTLATIQTQATKRVADTKDPLLQVSAELLRVPTPTIRVGDTVRFLSSERDIDRSLRIVMERRIEDDRGEIIEIDFESQRERFSADLAEQVPKPIDIAAGATVGVGTTVATDPDLPIRHIVMGQFAVASINNASFDATNRTPIQSAFDVVDGHPWLIDVLDEGTGSAGGDKETLASVKIQVLGAGTIVPVAGENGAYIQYKRDSGSNDLTLTVGYTLWGFTRGK